MSNGCLLVLPAEHSELGKDMRLNVADNGAALRILNGKPAVAYGVKPHDVSTVTALIAGANVPYRME